MTIQKAKETVKAWPDSYKAAVRRDVVNLNGNWELNRISAHTSYIIEKCFRKNSPGMNPDELLKFL